MIILLLAILLFSVPVAHAQLIGLQNKGVVTKNAPFTYVDNKIVKGDTYKIYLVSINVNMSKQGLMRVTTTLQFELNGAKFRPAAFTLGSAWIFNGGKGPTFTVEQIRPSRCLPRTNQCSEDAVGISVR